MYISWVAVSTSTDRPKSARSCCVIEGFGGFIVLSCCFMDFSVGVEAFVVGLRQTSSLFST